MNKITVHENEVAMPMDNWQTTGTVFRERYSTAKPFPYIVIDNFLSAEEASIAARAFPLAEDKIWTNYIHVNEKKYGLNKREHIPAPLLQVIDILQCDKYLSVLTDLTGIQNLVADEVLAGGGLHQTHPGGYLNVHSDFLLHPVKKNLMRRINLILFLSDDWQESYGGDLQFWNKDMTACEVRIQPRFNRCVIFNTDEYSYHGCPEKLGGPKGFARNTLALYYYTEYAKAPVKLYTDYKARPADRNKLAIYLDNKAVALYSGLKQRFNLTDDFVSRCLRFFKRG